MFWYVLSPEIIRFVKYSVIHESYTKMCEKMAKLRVHEKRYNFETTKGFWLKIWCGNYKAHKLSALKFQVCNFSSNWDIICQRASWPSRAGSWRLSTTWSKRDIFISISNIGKKKFPRNHVVWKSHKTVERSSRLQVTSTSLNVARNDWTTPPTALRHTIYLIYIIFEWKIYKKAKRLLVLL